MIMFKKEKGQNENPENSSSSVPALYRNRSGVVELVGREPLMFAKVENGVTKSCQNFRRKNRKNTGPGGSHGGGYTGQHVGGRSGASGVSELIALATGGRFLLVPVAPGPHAGTIL